MGLVGTIAGGILGLFGAVCLFGAAAGTRQYINYRRVSIEKGSDIADGDLVGVNGVVDDTGRFESPLTGTPCVAYEWQMEEYSRSSETHDWNTHVDEGELGEFTVETADGTRVTVVPSENLEPNAQLEFSDHEEVFRVQPGETPPDPVQRLVDRGRIEPNEETPGTELQNAFRGDDSGDDAEELPAELSGVNADHGERRYLERTLANGDEVYVYGQAERAGEGLRLTEGALFAISESDVSTLSRRYAMLSVVAAIAGVFSLLFAWGLVT